MGGVFSTTANPSDSHNLNSPRRSTFPANSQDDNSSSTLSNLPMNASDSKKDSNILEKQISKATADSSVATQTPDASDQSKKPPIGVNREEGQPDVEEGDPEDVEQGECGFCLFMKGGGCKDAFVAWEDCVKDADDKDEDVVEKCQGVTRSLTKCMEAHADYYEPLLRAEKAAREEAMKDLEKEKMTKETESIVAEREAVIVVDSKDWEAKEGSDGKNQQNRASSSRSVKRKSLINTLEDIKDVSGAMTEITQAIFYRQTPVVKMGLEGAVLLEAVDCLVACPNLLDPVCTSR